MDDLGVTLRMWIVGDGSARASAESQAAQLGLGAGSVTFLGRRSDIDRLLNAADFFVLPSDIEGLPLSILEAMAHGLPIVVSKSEACQKSFSTTSTGCWFRPAITLRSLPPFAGWLRIPDCAAVSAMRRASARIRRSRWRQWCGSTTRCTTKRCPAGVLDADAGAVVHPFGPVAVQAGPCPSC